jgi:ParB-like nuclease domain
MTEKNISPNDLHFDYKNPRISEFDINENTPESDILRVLWSAMGIEEIVLSIKASGFFQYEPLYVVEEGGRNIVIEGNRRLAAVKAILEPSKVNFPGVNKNNLNVSQLIKDQLAELPVVIVPNRQSAWKFIGFKHINGPQKWGSYAKAQYISEIYNEYHIPLTEIASQLGDTFNTVEKLYQGLQVINQAERKGLFKRTDVVANRLFFSHLYTGLQQSGFKTYLGIDGVPMDSFDPVPEEKLPELEELLNLLYGSKTKKIEPVIKSQNPDLRQLDAVLKKPEARVALKNGMSLITAFDLTRPKAVTFEEHLLGAKLSLQKASSFLSEGFDGTNMDLLEEADSIANMSDRLHRQMFTISQELSNRKSRGRSNDPDSTTEFS